MKLNTKQFIIQLLERELNQEIVNDNININEVDYVKDLVSASLDFIKCYGNIEDVYNVKCLINDLQSK